MILLDKDLSPKIQIAAKRLRVFTAFQDPV